MKKSLFKLLAVGSAGVLIASVATGCAQDEIVRDAFPEKTEAALSPMKISLSEAMGNADRVMRLIEDGRSTRSRVLEKVEYISTPGTRSGVSDTLFYVINYSGDNGFAVLSADRRLPEVYAISNEGHLDMRDTVDNKGLALFFSSLSAIPPIMTDTTVYEPITPPVDPPYYGEDKSYKVGPLLSPNVSRWHQRSPFNLDCPLEAGMDLEDPKEDVTIYTRTLVGCVPLSVGMIMSYYEWPESCSGILMHWREMKQIDPDNAVNSLSHLPIPQQSVPRFLARLGDKNNLNSFHTSQTTSAIVEETYKRTFVNFNYRKPSDFKEYSDIELKNLINDEKPVLIHGNGHIWVIDGLIFDADVEVINPGGMNYWKKGAGLMFHHVWGWKGNSNGYFRFDSNIIHVDGFKDENDPDWDEDWNYRFWKYRNLRICGDFEPLR